MEDAGICILWPFGQFTGNLAYFMAVWYIFPPFWYILPVFGMLF
jgi:hypothetical protein